MRASRVPRELSRKNAFGPDLLAAYRAALDRYAEKLWVTGITMGVKEVGGQVDRAAGMVLAIHIRKKRTKGRVPRAELIPRTILGIPTDVIEGTYTRSAGGAGSALPAFPLRPGSSYARHDGTAATLSGVVTDAAGVRYLLSTAHTLTEGGHFKKGDVMVHPGPADSQQPVAVAKYETVFFAVDAGIARLDPGIQAKNRALASNRAILTPDMPVVDDLLEKSGDATRVTRGEVRHIGKFGLLAYGMRLFLPAGDPGPIALPGDSGSTWYDTTTFTAKGLHIGVDASNSAVAIAAVFPEVMKKLKVTWELSS